MATFIELLETPTAGKAGHVAASSASERRLVRVVDANINAGLAVCSGATPGKTCKAPTTAAEARACLGILIDPEFLNELGAAADLLAGNQATLLESGFIWVNAEVAVAVDDLVYVRHTSDGGSNTTRGTLRNNSDGNIVLDTTATANGEYRVTLSNGVVEETFSFTASGSTADQVMTGLVSVINASANFNAVGTTEATITAQTGGEVSVVLLSSPTTATQANWSVVDNQKAARLKGARFASATAGAALAKVKLQLRQD